MLNKILPKLSRTLLLDSQSQSLGSRKFMSYFLHFFSPEFNKQRKRASFRYGEILSSRPSWTHRVGIGAREAPPDDRAVGSTGVERRRIFRRGGGCDSVRRSRAGPHAGHGSALHDSLSRGDSGSHAWNSHWVRKRVRCWKEYRDREELGASSVESGRRFGSVTWQVWLVVAKTGLFVTGERTFFPNGLWLIMKGN